MKQLLVVEDSRLIRTTMKRILVEEGFGVVDVSDGEEALQLARQSRPDLIILDMLLPKMGGELVLRSLKQDPTTTNVPVIVVSSLSQSNADKLKSDGAIAYIEKSGSTAQFGGKGAVENAASWKSPKAGLFHCAWKSHNGSGISTFSTAPATTG